MNDISQLADFRIAFTTLRSDDLEFSNFRDRDSRISKSEKITAGYAL